MDIQAIVQQTTQELLNHDPAVTAPVNCENLAPADVAQYIDHTLLKADASVDDIRRICGEAKAYKTASVCVNPSYIKLVAEELKGSEVTPCCVIGFPLGATRPEVKAFETTLAVNDGAREVDMVVNVGAVKSGDWKLVQKDISAVVNAAGDRALVKVIIETCLLTDEEKVRTCTIAKLSGAHFVKTSTGFSTGGATEEDVRLMRQTVGEGIGVKASGGVRSYADALRMLKAGANRLGASAAKKILSGE